MTATKTIRARYPQTGVLTLTVDILSADGTSAVASNVALGETASGSCVYQGTFTAAVSSSFTVYSANLKRSGSVVQAAFVGLIEQDGLEADVVDVASQAVAAYYNPQGAATAADVAVIYSIVVPSAVAQASQNPSVISCIRGDVLAVTLPVMGNISTRSKLVFTAKTVDDANSDSNTDPAAILQVVEGVGLTSLNGVQTGLTAADASLVVTDATTGAATLTIKAHATAQLVIQDLLWDCQWLDNSTPANARTPLTGTLSVVADVTQAVT